MHKWYFMDAQGRWDKFDSTESYQIEISYLAYNHKTQKENQSRDQYRRVKLTKGYVDVATL